MLVPTGYAPFKISFIAIDDKVDTSLFSEIGAWELIDTHVSAGEAHQNFQCPIVKFHIKRRASFLFRHVWGITFQTFKTTLFG